MPDSRRSALLPLLMAAFFGVMMARLVISPLIPDLMAAFAVSKGAMGLAMTGLWGAYAVFQLPGGVLAGRYGERPVILSALGLTGVGSLLLATAPSYPAFVLFALLMGAGSGAYFPAAAALLTERYPRTGQVLGFHLSGGDSAGLVAPVLAAAVGVRYGWRPALVLGAAVVVPVFLLCARRIPRTDPRTPAGPLAPRVHPRRLRGILTPPVAFTTVLATVLAFAFQATISFYPTFLIEAHGFDTGLAGLFLAGIFATWIPLLPAAGRVADTVGHDAVLAGTMASLALGFVVALEAGSVPAAVLAVVLLGVGMSFGGVIASRFMRHLAADERTEGYGLVRSVYMLVGSTGSVITGTVADLAGWGAAYGLASVLIVAALGVVIANRALGLGL